MDIKELQGLSEQLEGQLFFDELHKAIYATDASVYRKIPKAVAYPLNSNDLIKLINFAKSHHTSLVPRTAGTSLAGQCVGEGIIVDVSKHFTKIINIDESKKQVTLQPGVIRDELNKVLETQGLFFGPNTSTSNRCMIGGMVGNNSSGTTSIQYGTTRDKVVSMKLLLSDGNEIKLKSLEQNEFNQKLQIDGLEGDIYRLIHEELSNPENKKQIIEEFPKSEIHRRNTGYAIDELIKTAPFSSEKELFNLSKLISGSEGTLGFITEITLQLDELPPQHAAMIVTHYHDLDDSLKDVSTVMEHNLFTCEMMDKIILDCTKNNATQLKNRFFIHEDPAAVLMLEVRSNSEEGLQENIDTILKTIGTSGLSYAHPVLKGGEIQQALELRKAGLGLLGNMIGDKKAVACIEDTAVALNDLSSFIDDFSAIMKKHDQQAVYYAHAGAGELHLRPILNLKKSEDVKLFRQITTEVAQLTKQYQGSFSGEHGDGIVRAEFIPLMIGDSNYEILKRIKKVFDPKCVFNPGKIVDPWLMDASLRYEIDREEPKIDTVFDFSDNEGILRATEKCNGSGDCRKSADAKGAMCPSYHVTKDEKHTTRARANALRESLTQDKRFDNPMLKEVFDLCLSCKACASECPSNVDIASLKSEFLFQYQEKNGYSRKNQLVAKSTIFNKKASKFPRIANWFFSNMFTSKIVKSISGVASERTIPKISIPSFDKYHELHQLTPGQQAIKQIILFVDEFANYLDAEIAIHSYHLLTDLGYDVEIVSHLESGRTYLSKGFLNEAKALANNNIAYLKDKVSPSKVLLGIEPSAILSFRDEYLRLATDENKSAAEEIAKNTFLIEEFLAEEIKDGNIQKTRFTQETRKVKIHNHCHQKALSNQKVTFDLLNFVENYEVSIITSGCCGMAGSFGYEKEHYQTSMDIGALKLFPSIRKSEKETIIAANGTSCRHQIKDGTNRVAKHPVTIMYEALKK